MDEPQESMLFELADLILALGRHIQASKEGAAALAGGSWTPLEAAVMRFIDRHPGTTATETADATRLISSNTSRALRNLEKHELIRRVTDEHDARRFHLYPTEKAQENLRRLRIVWSRLLEGAISDVDQIEATTRTLRRIESELLSRSKAAPAKRSTDVLKTPLGDVGLAPIEG